MTNAIENARKRLEEIRREASEIERFLDMYARFDVGTDGEHIELPKSGASGNLSTDNLPVENGGKRRQRTRGARPDEIALIMERVIRERGQPLTRGQIVEALEVRDVKIPAVDKSRYIGTIAWRHKSIFVNIEGQGYWLRNEPAVRTAAEVFGPPVI